MKKADKERPPEHSSPEDREETGENVTYLLMCADGTLYCGWTCHLARRLRAHNAGTASRYTRSRRPVTLVYTERHATRAEAMAREYRIKQMTRPEKERLIQSASAAGPADTTPR